MDLNLLKTFDAVSHYNSKHLIVCGGVACNSSLRERLKKKGEETGIDVVLTPPKYCTDNAAMIAALGYHSIRSGDISDSIEAIPRAPLITSVPFFT